MGSSPISGTKIESKSSEKSEDFLFSSYMLTIHTTYVIINKLAQC